MKDLNQITKQNITQERNVKGFYNKLVAEYGTQKVFNKLIEPTRGVTFTKQQLAAIFNYITFTSNNNISQITRGRMVNIIKNNLFSEKKNEIEEGLANLGLSSSSSSNRSNNNNGTEPVPSEADKGKRKRRNNNNEAGPSGVVKGKGKITQAGPSERRNMINRLKSSINKFVGNMEEVIEAKNNRIETANNLQKIADTYKKLQLQLKEIYKLSTYKPVHSNAFYRNINNNNVWKINQINKAENKYDKLYSKFQELLEKIGEQGQFTVKSLLELSNKEQQNLNVKRRKQVEENYIQQRNELKEKILKLRDVLTRFETSRTSELGSTNYRGARELTSNASSKEQQPIVNVVMK